MAPENNSAHSPIQWKRKYWFYRLSVPNAIIRRMYVCVCVYNLDAFKENALTVFTICCSMAIAAAMTTTATVQLLQKAGQRITKFN